LLRLPASQGLDLAAKAFIHLGQTASRGFRGRGAAAFMGGAVLGRVASLEPCQQALSRRGIEQAKLLSVSLKLEDPPPG
jgi:hypothetical protein